jgi:hypothetical protein
MKNAAHACRGWCGKIRTTINVPLPERHCAKRVAGQWNLGHENTPIYVQGIEQKMHSSLSKGILTAQHVQNGIIKCLLCAGTVSEKSHVMPSFDGRRDGANQPAIPL